MDTYKRPQDTSKDAGECIGLLCKNPECKAEYVIFKRDWDKHLEWRKNNPDAWEKMKRSRSISKK